MKVALNTAKKRFETAVNIRKKYADMILSVAAPYSAVERETWYAQLNEADAWLLDNTAATPLITAMAATRNIPLALLVEKIKENDNLYRSVVGTLLGQQQAELDAVNKE